MKRRHPRPRLDLLDKLFWVAVRRFWSGWQQSLIAVTPETVVRWHKAGFRLYWKLISKARRPVGRRQTSKELQELIFQLLWAGKLKDWCCCVPNLEHSGRPSQAALDSERICERIPASLSLPISKRLGSLIGVTGRFFTAKF